MEFKLCLKKGSLAETQALQAEFQQF